MRCLACVLVLVLATGAGCARRSVLIDSNPTGALVYINGVEAGRTPMKYDFDLYGDFDVILRKDGYQTLKTHQKIATPLHGYPPFDLAAEALGVVDRYQWHFDLQPASAEAVDAAGLIERGRELEGRLQSSEHTRAPATQPTTRPGL
jgi:hypothetical protein